MKCTILHELPGRLRVHLCCGRMTLSQADVLEYYLRAQDGVQEVRVYDRTQDAVVLYDAERGNIIRALAQFSFAKAEAMELVPEHTSRALNREFEDKLAIAVMRRCISKLFLPAPITAALALLRSVKYIREGLSALWHGKLSVAVLDATAVTVSEPQPVKRTVKKYKVFPAGSQALLAAFMRRDKVRAFPSASGRPDCAGHVSCCNNGHRFQSSGQAPAYW